MYIFYDANRKKNVFIITTKFEAQGVFIFLSNIYNLNTNFNLFN